MPAHPPPEGNPSFDIVILALNREQETLRVFESIERQQGSSFHIWIVDQGSDPRCLKAFREALPGEQATLIEQGRNTGVAEGRNIGMRAGSAPYVLCIDNDAYFEDHDALVRIEARFEQDPDLGAISFSISDKPGGSTSKASWPFGPSIPLDQSEACLVAQFSGAAHAVRRSALEQTGYYDDKLFFYWEELDLAYQLINAGNILLYDPDIRVVHSRTESERLGWKQGRYYYQVRNGLYVRYKYERSLAGLFVYAAGYLVRGLRNGLASQALRGIADAIPLMRNIDCDSVKPLNPQARRYVWEYSLQARGGLPVRFFREALTRIPE